MIIAQKSNYTSDGRKDSDEFYTRAVDEDLRSLFGCLQGKVRFGSGTTGRNGENISGQFVQYTSNSVANTEDTITHTIGSIPIGYIVLWQDKAGSFYQTPTSGTDWSSSSIYLKCSVASVTALLFLIK